MSRRKSSAPLDTSLKGVVMKYVAIRASYGFRGRHWYEGDTFDADPGEDIPHHFKPVGEVVPPAAPKKDDKMAPRPVVYGKPPEPKGGFAAGMPAQNRVDFPTAGTTRKARKT